MNHTVSRYQKVQVETTDSVKLVVMLYEGAINFLEQAKLRVAENQVGEKGILINKVIAIISELQGSLNMSEGGEVAESLDRVYTYIINCLLEANINADAQAINEVLKHLRTLMRAWRRIADEGADATEALKSAKPEIPATVTPAVANPDGSRDSRQAIELVG